MELNIENRIKQLSEEIVKSPQDDALYYERGKLYWKAGMRAEAITIQSGRVAQRRFARGGLFK